MKIVITIIIIILSKFIYNLYYFLCARFYLKKYDEYIDKNTDNKQDGKSGWFISDNRQRIVDVFKKANIKDAKFTNIEEVGYGQIQSSHPSMFDNLAVLRKDVSPLIYTKFREAKQVYKNRIKDSFNPIFWVDFILYFPKVIFGYFDISGDKSIVKVFQLLWWLIGLVSALIGIFFNDNFINWVRGIIQ